jgi:isovaleryl-CoA dehydrogenase
VPRRQRLHQRFPAGGLLRDAKLYDIGAGTNEIRRMLIGRELFEESV